MTKKQLIYLDHASATPVDPRVLAAMAPIWQDNFSNPASIHHFGRRASHALEQARQTIAEQLHTHPSEIIFTSGGTESNNLALRGVTLAKLAELKKQGKRPHLIVSAIEHKSILETAHQLHDLHDCDVTLLPADLQGVVQYQLLESLIRDETVLVSVMAANNETGVIQPIEEVGKITRARGIPLHTDAAQTMKTMAWELDQSPIDLMTLSPHKFGAPRGIGILYVRKGIELLPVLTGGSQERELRAGTVNVAGAVGAAMALKLVQEERLDFIKQVAPLTHNFILASIDYFGQKSPDLCHAAGNIDLRLPFFATLIFKNLPANDILRHLDVAGIAVSSGSACTVGNPKPSHVLEAMGVSPEFSSGGVRFTFGRETTESEIEYTFLRLIEVIEKVQRLTIYN